MVKFSQKLPNNFSLVRMRRNRMKTFSRKIVAENYLRPLWWIAVFPGIALTVTIMAFNLIGDELRDRLDPKLKGEIKD